MFFGFNNKRKIQSLNLNYFYFILKNICKFKYIFKVNARLKIYGLAFKRNAKQITINFINLYVIN